MLETCRERGVGFAVYLPLGRGFLTGAIDPAQLAEGDFRRGNSRFQGESLVQNQRRLGSLGTFAAARRATPAQIALAWLVNRARQVVPIPVARKPARLAENAGVVDLVLSEAEIAALDTLFGPEAVAGARYAEGGTAGIELPCGRSKLA